MVNRLQYGKGTDYIHFIYEFVGIIFYIANSGHCFIKCNTHLTGNDYEQELLSFIRDGKERSCIKTLARTQFFCARNYTNLGDYNSKEIYQRLVTERNRSCFCITNTFLQIGSRKVLVSVQLWKNHSQNS